MDAHVVAVVMDAMQAPGVENPAFARAHVDGRVAAIEHHARLRDDGHVNAHPLGPVIRLVDVRIDFCLTRKAHQARSAKHGTETSQHVA